MREVQQNSTAHSIGFYMVLASDHVTPATGKSPVLKITKDGGASATASGAITETDATNQPGWYDWAGNATDRNTLGEIRGTATATGCDNAPVNCNVIPRDPYATNVSADAKAINGDATAAANLATALHSQSTIGTSTYAGADTAGTGTLLARIPGTVQPQTGDGYAIVNSGSFGNSALLSAIQNVQNNTFIATSIPYTLERPDSSSTSVSISIVFSDETGAAKNLDSGSPAITLVNDAGTDRSGRLGSITNPATGKYVVAYTNTSTDTIEGLHWDITGTINGKLRRMVAYTQIVDTTAVDFTSSDRTNLNSVLSTVTTGDFTAAMKTSLNAATPVATLAANGLDLISATPVATPTTFPQKLLAFLRKLGGG